MSTQRSPSAPSSRTVAVDRAFCTLAEQLAAAQTPVATATLPAMAEAPVHTGTRLSRRLARELFDSQLATRQLDLVARELRARGEGFYTISSAGHEGNAAVASALRPTDPALLHYRSGAFYLQRAKQVPGETPLFNLVLSLCASREEPISGGRHKVFGSKALAIIPQTSTIGSHLPKAVGLAVGIERAHRLRASCPYSIDSIVCCSFGDASLNHATAQAGFQTAGWVSYQNLPCPVLFVCEDNGTGISVPTPQGWVQASMQARAGVKYFHANGLDLCEAYDVATEAADYVRTTRKPAFLHLQTVRMLGHAGSDIETTYHTLEQIEATEADDPLLHGMRMLVGNGVSRADDLRAEYERLGVRLRALAEEVVSRPRHSELAEMIGPLAPLDVAAVAAEAACEADPQRLARLMEGVPTLDRPRHMAVLLNTALRELLAKYPEMLVFGEDVGVKGGVYHVTADLQRRAGRARVFDTLLDETSILGMAQGAGLAGLLPSPEIQYLAYVHNALDQLRGEACSMQFFTQAQDANPMVVRMASLAYQKGFGGHFHNDTSTAALRDIPGLIVACPSRGDDAVRMLRTLFAAAKVNGRVSVFLEPIALYMRKDLYEPNDGGWSFPYPQEGEAVPIGCARVYNVDPSTADDVSVITYGNGVVMALRAAWRLHNEYGQGVRVVDLRWLQPLDVEAICAHARATGKVLVVDEGRHSGGVAEPVMALLAEREPGVHCERICGADTYLPLGDAAELCLPSEDQVVRVLLACCGVTKREPALDGLLA